MKAETELQNRCVNVARRMGETVLILGANKNKGSNTPGTPDLLLYCGAATWLAIEIKTPEGRLSSEQTQLHEQGKIIIVRDLDAFITAVAWAKQTRWRNERKKNGPH